MQLIDDLLLNLVSEEAKANPRLRMNYNFHLSPNSPVQRLLNALEPGAQIPVHRHRLIDETYILLRGKITVTAYNEAGEETEKISLDPQKGQYGLHIPAGQWHSLEVQESDSVILEVKEGPYTPTAPEDIWEE